MMSEDTNSVGNKVQMDGSAINATVLEGKIAQKFSEAMPELRFHGETPIRNGKDLDTPVAKSVKRSCAVLSPAEEAHPDVNLEKTVESSIKRSIDNLVPCILETIRTELRNTISEVVDAKISDLRNELDGKVNLEATKSKLKTLSESELLETYNRRDNIKVLGLSPCSTDGKENYQQTSKLVVDVAADIGMNLKEEDISIAHRLPSNSERKPIIAKFVRRVTKLDFMKKKRNLAQSETYKNVKVFEDLSKARVNFINLMKADDRINSVWSREGTLFYEWKYDNLAYKIHGLYEGGIDLNYSIESVLNCFNSFIPPPRADINNQNFRQPNLSHDKQQTHHVSAMPSNCPKIRTKIFFSSPLLKLLYIKATQKL